MNAVLKTVIASVVLTCGAAAAVAQTPPPPANPKPLAPKPTPKPTGACTISVAGLSPTCTGSMTLDGCNAVAAKVGGVAKWDQGKACGSN